MSTTASTQDQWAAQRSIRMRVWLERHIQTLSIAAVLLILIVYFAFTADAFLTAANLWNVLRQAAPTLIVGLAMTFVITTAGIDLSVGSTVALSGSLMALMIQHGQNPTIAFIAMLALGALVGAANGYFSAYQGMPPFIVTLATLSVVGGIALTVTNGYSIAIPSTAWVTQLGQGALGAIPAPALIALVLAVVAGAVFALTPFGQHVVALGSNAESLRRSGVNTRFVTLMVYVMAGFAAALAGILIAARLGSGSSNAGGGNFMLEVITAVVLGGTDLFGGEGSILGTVFGVLVLEVIANGLILLHVSPFYVQIVQGIILLAAILSNTRLFAHFAVRRR